MAHHNPRDISGLLDLLCKSLSPRNHKSVLQHASTFIANSTNFQQSLSNNELTTITKIKHLLKQKSHKNVDIFMELYESLSTMDVQHRSSVLMFLLSMTSNSNCFVLPQKLDLEKSASTPSLSAEYKKIHKFSEKSESVSLAVSSNLKYDTLKKFISVKTENSQLLTSTTDEYIKDAINSFIGVPGKFIRKDIDGGFRIDPKIKHMSAHHSNMLIRLAELGYLKNQVVLYTDKSSGTCPIGLLGQGLITAVKNELTKYYGLVANLQVKFNQQCQADSTVEIREKLTLQMLLMWSVEPLGRLTTLSAILESCQDKKGGSLASSIYNFMASGTPSVKTLVNELLSAVCIPLQTMLSKWLLDGEIEDPYSEFFIEVIPEVGSDRLWHDKYRLREALLPNFISIQLANKILVTGKSINYLRELCQDSSEIAGRDELKQCLRSNVESLFSSVADTELHIIIENIYLSTSKKVLDIVMGPHKLLEHLQAMRRYLLLGQGDFIGLLMENLKPELDRPGKELNNYNLSSIVDGTVRATNAENEDPEILNHLDVRLMNAFAGDTGWDIFTLRYTVRGPLSPILEPCMETYNILFKPLWKSKHIEWVLSSKIWKQQKCSEKLLRCMSKELKPITHHLNLYTSQMIHFTSQMQYYILFEVLECSWATFLDRVNKAKALDDILDAHHNFLESVRSGTFLDEKSCASTTNLDSIYSLIMNMETWQENFYEICFKELELRKAYDNNIIESEKKGEFGVTVESRLTRDNEIKYFNYALSTCKKQLLKIGLDYDLAVRHFLLSLASTNDNKLQLFGTRLDFNEYYKKRDHQLAQPLTYEHMRMSSHYGTNKSLHYKMKD